MKNKVFLSSYNLYNILFVVALLALLFFKAFVLLKFGFKYTDSDQTIMWHGAYNFSQGLFHEPRFYGQAYNSMLEAFLATPLLWISIPPYVALPIVTSILSILPYLILSFFLFHKKSTAVAIIILCIPLMLPIEYHFISCMSRGFITGIAVVSIGTLSLFYREQKFSFFALAFISVVAYSINPNAALIAIPCLFYMFLQNIRDHSYFLYSALGLGLGIAAHLAVDYFYILHPNYILHGKASISWEWEKFYAGINHMDFFFNDVSPLINGSGWLILLLFSLWGLILTLKKDYPKGLVLLLIPILIILSLGVPKVHDGCESVFFSWSRMYLAFPIIICLCLAFFIDVQKKWIVIAFITIAISSSAYQSLTIERSIASATSEEKTHIVEVVKIDSLKSECSTIAALAKANKVDLIVLNSHSHKELYTYACSSCEKNFPKTLRPQYERRTWRLIEDSKTIYSAILIIEPWQDLTQKNTFVTKIGLPLHGYYLIKNNRTPTIELIKSFGIPVRRF